MTTRLHTKIYSGLLLQVLGVLFFATILQKTNAQSFTSGNIAVFVAAASANNTTGSIVELNTISANQLPASIHAIDGATTPDELRFSGSATSTCYLANSNDGTLLCFTGHNNINTSANANTLNPRGVGTFNSSGTFALQTTYTGSSGNQTRCATTINNSAWFIADQGGLYTNGTTSASPAGNFRGSKSFGGIVYVSSASSTSTVIQVSAISAPVSGTLTGLPGLTNNATIQDFYLISSGTNGSAYDVLYIVSATSNTVGTITKFSLVSGSWAANGSYTTGFGGFGLAAKKNGTGADLFVSSGMGALVANSVIKLNDAAGYNATIDITTANNVNLYTSATGTIIKGVAFAPIAAASIPNVNLSVSTNNSSEAAPAAITVTATASAPVSGDQTVNLGITGTGITAGDYSISGTTITILNGSATSTATFTVTDDNVLEGTETAMLTISSPTSGITLGTTTSQNITIADNEGGIDLSTYVRIGRYDLPEPTRTTPPANSLLAQEASGVTYDWDTQTLFVVGDGGTSVVQVTKTGQLINSMTLAPGSSPQGTEFYDPEGITYVGNGQFVLVEERDRQAVLFTYVAGGTLVRSATQTVKLGTFVQNIGIEGISYDPLTSGFICVKEKQPEGIFQTGIDFNAGTATNGSPTTDNSIDLFDPALANLLDFADVFALSNLPSLQGQPNYGNLLVLSQESGKIINVDRSGNISSSLTIMNDAGNPLSVPAQQHEGITMDREGILYTVSENGGGDFDHPQLWVYAPSLVPNQAPTAITLSNRLDTIAENTSTTSPIKVADIMVTDDGLGNNNLTLSGPDANFFDIVGTELYLKAGTVLDYETKISYSLTINVDDPAVGGTPDATTTYTLNVSDVVVETPPGAGIIVSEVAPWSSGNSPIVADWFEVTNTGASSVNITGWKIDDNSASFASAVALNGITTITAGESVIFIESSSPASIVPAFKSLWFGANPPAGLQIGTYSGSGVGLSTGGDAVNLYDGSGALRASVTFGASPAGPFPTFNNAAGLNNTTISQLSMVGVNGAFVASNDANEIGSPGTIGKLFISEVAPWSSGNSPVGADWFEVTNTRAAPVNITGWKIDDASGSFAAAVPLSGITSIAPGESVIFIETADLPGKTASFTSNWFGATPPIGLQIGNYTGSSVGLSTGGDAVNLYDSTGVLQASVIFGTSPAGPTFASFDNAAGLNNTTISQLSVVGVNGAFVAKNDPNEIGSPGTILTVAANQPPVVSITFPTNGATFNAGTDVTVQVQASDPDGSVTKVELFVGDVKFAEDITAPYSFTGMGVEPGTYKLTAKATDNNGATSVSDTVTVVFTACSGSGTISAEGYTDITGSQVSDLTSSPKYPDNPDVTATLNKFEYGPNYGDNYGARVRGYICAPVTGNYTFYIAGDDQDGLWLSTDEDPDHKALIAYNISYVAPRAWYSNASQKSLPIRLVKGGRYYIETLHKEYLGADHLAVAWQIPGGAFEGPIPGSRLSPYSSSIITARPYVDFEIAMANKNNKLFKVTASPNPSQSYFTITTKTNSDKALSIMVTDVMGRVVEKRTNVSAGGIVQVGRKLSAGVYFIEVKQGEQKARLKVVRQ